MITKEYLLEEYIQKQKSAYQIGKQCKAHIKTVHYYLIKYNIPRRPKRNFDLTGQKIDKLTVLKKIDISKNGTFQWLCKCDCGNQIKKSSTYLLGSTRPKNKIATCPTCTTRECFYTQPMGPNNCNWKGYGTLSGNKWQNMKNCAKHRNIKWNISIKDVYDIYNEKCALTGMPIVIHYKTKDNKKSTASLDRIDSTKDYSLDNIWWVHKDINLIKASWSVTEFIQMCKLVINPDTTIYQPDNKIYSDFWSDLQWNAKKRKIKVEIEKQPCINLLYKQGFKCAITGQFIHLNKKRTASLDRIDSSKGYTYDNIQWVHKNINQSRKHLDLSYYIELCRKVIEYNVCPTTCTLIS